MHTRSIGVTVLAFSTVMLAIYSQYAAISLLLTGAAFTVGGGLVAVITLFDGAAFLVLMVGGYSVAFGLWTRRAWAHGYAMALYMTFLVANIVLSILATNFVSAIIPTVAVAGAIAYARRAQVRSELAGDSAARDALETVGVAEVAQAAKPAH